jgi:2-iminobutanoate/2-iminopropanoate deaminase
MFSKSQGIWNLLPRTYGLYNECCNRNQTGFDCLEKRSFIMPRKTYYSPGIALIGTSSHAAEGGPIVYVSGQPPIDPDTGKLVEGGIRHQALQAFQNVFSILSTAGLTQNDVLHVNIYLSDLSDLPAVNAVYARQFTAPYPALTVIGVAALPLDARIQIDMVAYRTESPPVCIPPTEITC